jgi:hypothetical protein
VHLAARRNSELSDLAVAVGRDEYTLVVRERDGRLELHMPNVWEGRRNWSDGTRGHIEGKLGSVFAELDARVEEDRERRAEQAREEEARRLQWERALDVARQRFAEDKRAERYGIR